MTTISYFKRFRMEIDLNDLPPPEPLPEGYTWVAWNDALVDLHADVKAHCFADEVDAVLAGAIIVDGVVQGMKP